MNHSRRWVLVSVVLAAVLLAGTYFLATHPGGGASESPPAATSGAGPLAQRTHRVFVLHSYHRGYGWTDNLQDAIEGQFERSGLKIEPTCFYMDAKRVVPTAEYLEGLRRVLRFAYAGSPFDAVLACDNDALGFLRAFRDELFPGVPLVFTGINDFSNGMLDGRNDLTGTGENTDYRKTLALALSLRPRARRMIVVTDDTTTGRAHRRAILRDEPAFTNRLRFENLSLGELSMEEAVSRLAALDESAVVLLLQQFKDRTGRNFSIAESTALLASRCPVPCFVVNDSRMGFGALGGSVVSGSEHGKAGADRVVAILRGTPPARIPVSLEVPDRFLFDARALERFGIPRSALPPGNFVAYGEESLLSRYRAEILAGFFFLCLALTFMILMGFEILRRRRTEEALRESEAKLRAIFENSRDAIGLNLKGIHTYANPAYLALFGFEDPAQLIGLPILDLVAPSCHAQIIEYTRMRNEGLPLPSLYETRGRRRDGTEFALEVSASTVELRGGRHTLVSLRDISARKDSEERLRQSEEQFRSVVESSPMGMYFFVLEGERLLLTGGNPAADRITGLSREKLIGRPVEEVLPGLMDTPWLASFYRVARGETGPEALEIPYRDPRLSGFFDVRLFLSGASTLTVNFADIAERKRLEREVIHATRLAAVGELAAGVAHEFNNILSIVRLQAQVLLSGTEPLPQRVRSALDEIDRQATRGGAIVTGMMQTHRPSTQAAAPYPLQALVDEALLVQEKALALENISVVRLYHAAKPVCMERAQLNQVLLNLVLNARHALAPKKGGTLTIATRDLGDRVELRVSDTGIGIPEAVRDKLFTPFSPGQRAPLGAQPGIKGSGLGLSVCHQLVKNHGGSVQVESMEGVGTTFLVSLPAAPPLGG